MVLANALMVIILQHIKSIGTSYAMVYVSYMLELGQGTD